ncbi:MAG: RecQ family ATP-dependent DNA helicase [Clostridiales bacterium]|jgi:ATP-dependent DNA helicase RecQ|nr:RecQ family ATP-dependent DNA helicase [Clostridiales bacterium]MDR2749884.1 RecQ family ATP-dependent DNA helicase [Clostridiales bacterium]
MMDKMDMLKSIYGYDEFRDSQEKVVDSILSGNDCFCVMPTGAGKSLCYQVPALMFTGVSIVISPLVSLMKDQVMALVQLGVRAAYINSTLTEAQIARALANAKKGVYKIIYVAPERLDTWEFREFAQTGDISMVAVDEAHCVSQWGQDFRTSYLKISGFVSTLKKRPVVCAFTATATVEVRKDIVHMLELRHPLEIVTGFDRQNLRFFVEKPKKKFEWLVTFLGKKKGLAGIVYCSTRKNVDMVHDKLSKCGLKTAKYHAGLPDSERKEMQDRFIYDKDLVMVATNAFGMGIDKSNVSFVVHYNMPLSMEAYYQEAGRAGRDGSPADCVLLYSAGDLITSQMLIESSTRFNADAQAQRTLHEREWFKLGQMVRYCKTRGCLRQYILRYFNEHIDDCGNCGNCLTEMVTFDATREAALAISCIYKSGQRYGGKMIVDVLKGVKNEKTGNLSSISTFGASNASEELLEEVLTSLEEQQYISASCDKYRTLRLEDKCVDILERGVRLEIKMPKTQGFVPQERMLYDKLKALRFKLAFTEGVEPAAILSNDSMLELSVKRPATEGELLAIKGVEPPVVKRHGEAILALIAKDEPIAVRAAPAKPIKEMEAEPVDRRLLQSLKELRKKISSEAGVPAYAVFTDSTLMDMCLKLPENNAQMLAVSGVGHAKMDRYGEMFLDAIARRGELAAIPEPEEAPPEITDEPVSISVIADRINTMLIQRGLKKISGAKINKWLIREGFLVEAENTKLPTAVGVEMGIVTVQSMQGSKYSLFGAEAQKFIQGKVDELLAFQA